MHATLKRFRYLKKSYQRRIQNLLKHLRWSFLQKMRYLRCLTKPDTSPPSEYSQPLLFIKSNKSKFCEVDYPAGNYMFKVINRNYRTRSEICLKLAIKIPERRQSQWRRSGVFIINFEHVSRLVLVFLLLTLSR